MSIRTLAFVTSLFALGAPVAAQSIGVGYAGGTLSPCLDVNVSSANTAWVYEYDQRCYEVTNTTGGTLTLHGLGFWVEQMVSPTVPVYVYLKTSGGAPEWTPIRTGTLSVDYTQTYRQAGFAPLSIANGDSVFVSIGQDCTYRRKSSPYGTTHTAFTRGGTKWIGSYQFRPCVRLLCWRQFELLAPTVHQIAVGWPLKLDVQLDVNAAGVLLVGFSKTSWNGLPLPFDLGRFGATGAMLHVEPMVTLPLAFDPTGHAQITIPVPPRAGLDGVELHTQSLAFIRDANPLGLGTSNGYTTTLRR